MRTATRAFAAAALAAAAFPAGAAAGLPRGDDHVALDPADFSTRITNPWWPMRPGSRWVYRETDSGGARQKVVVTVTRRTKRIANGVTARVVSDVATEDGEPVEVTDDYYAQDRDGNVWYLGEATAEYERGKVVSRSSLPTGTTRVSPPTRSTTVGRPFGSRAVVIVPRGLFSSTWRSACFPTSRPSTRTTLVPSTKVLSSPARPSTVTRPALISSSAPRREASPARARYAFNLTAALSRLDD